MRDCDRLQYIKTEWDDIHHSRHQEWKALGAIAAILATLSQLSSSPLGLKVFLCFLGFIFSILGAWMALQHRKIMMTKIKIICNLEKEMGIDYPSRYALFPVQYLIYFLFVGIASGFAVGTIFLLKHSQIIKWATFWIILIGTCFILTSIVIAVIYRIKTKKQEIVADTKIISTQIESAKKTDSTAITPYIAELNKLTSCLDQLDINPLKIIVPSLLTKNIRNKIIKEIEWREISWDFENEELKSDEHTKVIEKPVILNNEDTFQFSMANEHTKQEWHYHQYCTEIYISRFPLEFSFLSNQNSIKTKTVQNGFIIVPPSLAHYIRLHGTTYVFQSSSLNKKVSSDKVKINI